MYIKISFSKFWKCVTKISSEIFDQTLLSPNLRSRIIKFPVTAPVERLLESWHYYKIGKKFNDKSFEKDFKDNEDDDMILDVGSKTLVEIKRIIDDSSTILWNGPLGYFENENFSLGSSEVAKYIANRGNKIFSVVGGGDTVAVINSLNMKDKFNFVSTAGGAFLEYLEGKVLPGIKALN